MKRRAFSLSIIFLICFFTFSIHSNQTPVKSKLSLSNFNNKLISSIINNEFITDNKYQFNPNICFGIQDENFVSSVTKYYCRLLGGLMYEEAYSIAIDKEGYTYITGTTMSKDFPTTKDAFDRSYNEKVSTHTRGDVFVSKISPDGKLVYSTFIGGETGEIAYSIVVDEDGCAYITGMTLSYDFPTTKGAISRIYNSGSRSGAGDAFVAKLSSDGSSLLYSTFLGGERGDYGLSITLDAEKNIYVAGVTNSWNFPITKGALKENLEYYYPTNGFITKISPDGGRLIYSTFFGGSSDDSCYSITVDKKGYAYVTGVATSSDFPITENAFDKGRGGDSDAFISKLSPDGSTLIYSTFLGGSKSDDGISITVDEGECPYILGETESPDFPTTENVWSRNLKGNGDIFIAKIKQDGSNLVYSTLLGGSTKNRNIYVEEIAFSIAIDRKGCAYITGYTSSPDFPIIPESSDKIDENSQEAFITKISADGSDILYSQLLSGSWSVASGFRAPWSIGRSIKLLEKDGVNHSEIYIAGDANWDGVLVTGEKKTRKEPPEIDAFIYKLLFSDKPEREAIVITLTIGDKEAFINNIRFLLDTPPIIINGRTLVPLRFIAEAFGAKVDWIPKNQEVVIHYGLINGIIISLQIGEKEATIRNIYEGDIIDEKIIDLDTPPIIINGRTLVPLRFIAEAFGAKVDWIPEERKVIITHFRWVPSSK